MALECGQPTHVTHLSLSDNNAAATSCALRAPRWPNCGTSVTSSLVTAKRIFVGQCTYRNSVKEGPFIREQLGETLIQRRPNGSENARAPITVGGCERNVQRREMASDRESRGPARGSITSTRSTSAGEPLVHHLQVVAFVIPETRSVLSFHSRSIVSFSASLSFSLSLSDTASVGTVGGKGATR